MKARALALVLGLAACTVARAQDSRLATRLDQPTFAAVTALIDSARSERLPTAPLVDKALEGAAKGSDGPKIVVAVRLLSARMSSARRALGTRTTSDEVKAAVTALDAGVSPHDLALLRAASGRRLVTVPLAVLTDLIGRGVPVATATTLVIQLARARVRDPEFMVFQRNVRADIDRGADPAVAATTRARGMIIRSNGTGRRTE